MKKKRCVIELQESTRDNLMKIKYNYGFSSVDALIIVLIKNTKLLKEVIKNEQ